MTSQQRLLAMLLLTAFFVLSRSQGSCGLLRHPDQGHHWMHASKRALICQAAAAALMVQLTINQASLIPDHARSRLLGSEFNSLYKQPRQIHSKFYVKPRDNYHWPILAGDRASVASCFARTALSSISSRPTSGRRTAAGGCDSLIIKECLQTCLRLRLTTLVSPGCCRS